MDLNCKSVDLESVEMSSLNWLYLEPSAIVKWKKKTVVEGEALDTNYNKPNPENIMND